MELAWATWSASTLHAPVTWAPPVSQQGWDWGDLFRPHIQEQEGWVPVAGSPDVCWHLCCFSNPRGI